MIAPSMTPCPRCRGKRFHVTEWHSDVGLDAEWIEYCEKKCTNCGHAEETSDKCNDLTTSGPPHDPRIEVVGEDDHPGEEQIYDSIANADDIGPSVVLINDEIRRYLAAHPEKVYDLTPRKFEELVADILHDLGFGVELTQATRDGGVDIYAYIKTAVCDFLVFVECKRWSPDRHVGLDVVQRLYGVQQIGHANKSMIITTSFFTEPAIQEVNRYQGMMTLRDYNHLKRWLVAYTDSDRNPLIG